MKRLTYDFCFNGSHSNQVKGADNLVCSEVCEREGSCKECPIARAFDRLAAIEDILGDDYNLDHLRELIQADRDGRCMILPAKLGTHLFVRHKDGDSPVVVESTVVGAHVKDTESYRGAPRKEYIVVRSNGFSKHISVDQIGKTAFFSREEALAGKRSKITEMNSKGGT